MRNETRLKPCSPPLLLQFASPLANSTGGGGGGGISVIVGKKPIPGAEESQI